MEQQHLTLMSTRYVSPSIMTSVRSPEVAKRDFRVGAPRSVRLSYRDQFARLTNYYEEDEVPEAHRNQLIGPYTILRNDLRFANARRSVLLHVDDSRILWFRQSDVEIFCRSRSDGRRSFSAQLKEKVPADEVRKWCQLSNRPPKIDGPAPQLRGAVMFIQLRAVRHMARDAKRIDMDTFDRWLTSNRPDRVFDLDACCLPEVLTHIDATQRELAHSAMAKIVQQSNCGRGKPASPKCSDYSSSSGDEGYASSDGGDDAAGGVHE